MPTNRRPSTSFKLPTPFGSGISGWPLPALWPTGASCSRLPVPACLGRLALRPCGRCCVGSTALRRSPSRTSAGAPRRECPGLGFGRRFTRGPSVLGTAYVRRIGCYPSPVILASGTRLRPPVNGLGFCRDDSSDRVPAADRTSLVAIDRSAPSRCVDLPGPVRRPGDTCGRPVEARAVISLRPVGSDPSLSGTWAAPMRPPLADRRVVRPGPLCAHE